MFGRWRRALERKSFDASNEHGWDLRKAQLGEGDLADYFTKMAHEVTGAAGKHGRSHGGRTPMQLLADGVLAYFTHRASNGPTEAINGRLEALRRNALGFRNLINYRIRSLLHCGSLAL